MVSSTAAFGAVSVEVWAEGELGRGGRGKEGQAGEWEPGGE